MITRKELICGYTRERMPVASARLFMAWMRMYDHRRHVVQGWAGVDGAAKRVCRAVVVLRLLLRTKAR